MTATHRRKFALSILTLLTLAACTRHHELAPGTKPFASIAVKSVLNLTWVHQADGKPAWSARLEHREDGRWLFLANSPGATFLDRRANRAFFDHLVDALRSVQVVTDQGRAEDSTLAAQGLAPPRDTLEWTAREADRPAELQFGETTPARTGIFARFPAMDSVHVYAAEGSLAGVIKSIEGITGDSLRNLRIRGWAEFTADDVDEITITSHGASLYAQRDGDHWADKNHHPLSGPAIDSLLSAAISDPDPITFIDDPAASQKALSSLSEKSELQLEFRGRSKRLGLLKLSPTPSELAAVAGNAPWIAADFSSESAPGFAFGASARMASVKLPTLPK